MNINCKSYADLEKEAQAVDGLTSDFLTLPYLANLNSSYHWMFPDPARVFCSLMRCRDQFSDERRFSKEEYVAYKDWLLRNVGVSRYELRTRMAVMRNKKATGFTGYVTYELKDKENPWNKTTYMLARYAEYANVGGNKTAAYGQANIGAEKRQ